MGEGGRLALCLVVAREREEKGKEKGKGREREKKIFSFDVFGYRKERIEKNVKILVVFGKVV